ncbi:hypothetical protein SteCoe_36554 [Stentor coeruleus]|uniref:Uncharacterized protein n=1 Tax=Stentor coeruleus TaxID=5963 RepID=A0A1R2APW6_9CILI|nr:hypothetical protein SteCoe_36554 [Stentor coeruleus]
MDTNLKNPNNIHIPIPSIELVSANTINSSESLYKGIESIDISIPSNGSSADSIDIQVIKNKNKELFDVLNSRLSTFLNFNDNIITQSYDFLKSSLDELDEIKDTANDFEDKQFSLCDKDKFAVDILFKQINLLHSMYTYEIKKLERSRDELITVEEEETDLHFKLKNIEGEMCRLMIEEDSNRTTCKCTLF